MESDQFDNFIPQLKQRKFNLRSTLSKLKLNLQMRQNLHATCINDKIYSDVYDAEHDLNSVSQEIEAYSALGIQEQSVSIRDFFSAGNTKQAQREESDERS